MGIVEGPVGNVPVGSVFGENSFYRETWGTRLGCGLWVLSPPLSYGVGTRGNFVLSSPTGKWAQKTCAGCPKQRYATGEQGRESGTGPCGDCRTVLWVPASQGLYSGKCYSIGKPGIQD